MRPEARTSSSATAASTAAASATQVGELPVSSPTATPARATWPMPSPISDSRRWTTNTPTSGATVPTISAASRARRMKS